VNHTINATPPERLQQYTFLFLLDRVFSELFGTSFNPQFKISRMVRFSLASGVQRGGVVGERGDGPGHPKSKITKM